MDATIPLPALMSQKQAAAYLGFSEKKLERDRWCEKQIPYVKLGRNVRYRASDLMNYVNGNVVNGDRQ